MKKSFLVMLIVVTIVALSGKNSNAQNINLDSVSVDSVVSITMNSATVLLHVKGMTDIGFYTVSYGVSPNYNSYQTTPTLLMPVNDTVISVVIPGLSPVTNYSYRGKILPGAASGVSPIGTFTTGSCLFSPTVSPSGTNNLCSGNSIVLTASPSVGSTFQWNKNGIIILGATNSTYLANTSGVYTCNVTNGGCTSTTSGTTVNVNSVPSVLINPSSSVICAGASVILTASGSNTYQWDNGAITDSITVSPNSTTTYTVTGSNGGCVGTQTVTVTVSGAITIIVNPLSATICAGENLTIVASGTATNYNWSNGATTNSINVAPSSTTTYTVTASNIGCTATVSSIVNVNQNVNLAGVANADICLGSSTQFNVTGASNFSWVPTTGLNDPNIGNPIANPSATTVYVVTGSNGSCSESATVVLTVNNIPVVDSAKYSSGSEILALYGSFPGNISSININGNIYVPYFSNGIKALFHNISNLIDGNIIIITTVSTECFTWYTFTTTSITEGSATSICIKQNEQINLFDLTGRKIKTIYSPRDFMQSEIFEVKSLFNDLPFGCYFWSSTKTTQKFLK